MMTEKEIKKELERVGFNKDGSVELDKEFKEELKYGKKDKTIDEIKKGLDDL